VKVPTLRTLFILRAREDDAIVIVIRTQSTRYEEERMARTRKASPAIPVKQPVQAPETPPPARELVRGIRLEVSGQELVVRIGERIRWHRERGDVLLGQMKQLAEVERSAADKLADVFGRYDSPRAMLEKKLREHQERASFLTFVRDHVRVDGLYQLDSSDLRMTEILPERSW
jgi:hypothetical protein